MEKQTYNERLDALAEMLMADRREKLSQEIGTKAIQQLVLFEAGDC